MRGLPEFNFPAFMRVAAYLQTAAWDVFNPAQMDLARVEREMIEMDDLPIDPERVWAIATDEENVHFSFSEVMAEDLHAVCRADAVVVMPGWEESVGGELEVHVAHAVGVPVYSWPSMRRITQAAKDLTYDHDEMKGNGYSESLRDAGAKQLAWMDEMERIEREVFPDARPRSEVFVTLDPDPIFRDQTIPADTASRKALPITSGVIDYFPAALAEVARVSKAGNDKHNPGEEMHHARGKSMDHADSIARHLIDRGKIDAETGQRHSAELAWRALALLQEELEREGLAPMPRGART